MRKIDSILVGEAEKYVMNLFSNSLAEEFLFHSKKHTLDVCRNASLIGQLSGLNEDELNVLRVSALFHDAGYIMAYADHETESAFIAGEFLRFNGVGEPDINLVTNAILATRVPQHPTDRISGVLCDADLMHLTREDYFEQMELLRLEWQITGRHNFTEYEFHLNSIDFFNSHHFHSEYGKSTMEAKKQEILRKIREKADSLREA